MSQIVWFEVTTEAIADFREEHLSRLAAQICSVKHPDTHFEIEAPNLGIPSIDAKYRPIWIREVLKIIANKQMSEGAIVMGCFADIGVKEARCVARIPVVGPGQSCFYAASLLSGHFSVLTSQEDLIPVLQANARTCGVDHYIASWGNVGLSISGMQDRQRTKQRVIEEINHVKKRVNAQAVILGCTVLAGIASEIQSVVSIPILDPVSVTFQMAEILAALGKGQP